MKKILIVTLYGEFNFGNRLQNYALQKMVEENGYKVDNLVVVKPPIINFVHFTKTIIKYFFAIFSVGKFKRVISKERRARRFLLFREKFFDNIIFYPQDDLNSIDWDKYQYVITGSDQVWHNWHKVRNELGFYYLDFITPKKRVSYAPSFGFTEFPREDLEAHRKGLMGMKALSCREQEGCKLIKDLTGREAVKVLDPTLLLSRKDWETIEKKPDFSVPDNYLLMFFLGDITDEYRKEIARIKNLNNLKVLNINDLNDSEHYAVSPDEFIWLIHHADTVCTDSFHASVFSIIFNKNLRVFERIGKYENMFGRLHDLLEPLGLLKLVFGHEGGNEISTVLSDESVVYLEKEKQKSLQYLRDALNS